MTAVTIDDLKSLISMSGSKLSGEIERHHHGQNVISKADLAHIENIFIGTMSRDNDGNLFLTLDDGEKLEIGKCYSIGYADRLVAAYACQKAMISGLRDHAR